MTVNTEQHSHGTVMAGISNISIDIMARTWSPRSAVSSKFHTHTKSGLNTRQHVVMCVSVSWICSPAIA